MPERIEILDVLRGLAVGGILIGNLQWFSGYGFMPPAVEHDTAMVDQVTHFLRERRRPRLQASVRTLTNVVNIQLPKYQTPSRRMNQRCRRGRLRSSLAMSISTTPNRGGIKEICHELHE